tara:strand:- start:1199 stop:2149 length:951 start_codon:yes stop_codon:yes gene_type:complete
MKKRKNNEVFSMSFLDIMACGFGALVLILLISDFKEVEIVEQKYSANLFLEKQKIQNDVMNKLNLLELNTEIKINELIKLQDEVNSLEINLREKENIVNSLNNITEATSSQIELKKLVTKSTIEQISASGILIDSNYLIFIIDNSGSMIEGAPWKNVMSEISNIINTFPNLEGFMVMNDTGKIIVGDNPWLLPTIKNRSIAIDALRNIRTISMSNPIPAIELAINFYGRKYDNVGLFIIGDDIRENKNIDNRLLEINRINTKTDGTKYVRINALAFLTSRRISEEILPSGKRDNTKYLTLMRELTLQNGGTLVVID